ncbi:MAG: enoyl-CoA hydratase/isomerase family protein [Halanaeroarchaeum sp.]
MSFELLETERIGSHRRIRLAVPGKPNPISDAMQDELETVLDEVETADDVRVVTFAGAGDAFAVGADVTRIESWVSAGEQDRLMQFLRDGQLLMERIANLDVVTVAGIDGYALGGGLELALACDVRLATSDSTLGFPEVDLGLIPGWGGTQRLPRVVGKSRARDMLVTGRHVDGEEALEMGLVDRLVAEDVDGALEEYAETLAEKPPATLRYLLDAVETGTKGPVETGLGYELLLDLFSGSTEEARERLSAFVED